MNSITFIVRLILIKFINLLNKIQRVINVHRILEFNSNLLCYLRGSVLPDFFCCGGGGVVVERGEEKAKALYIGLNMPPVIIKGKGLACDCHLLPKCIAWENQSVIALCLSFFIS